jgi:DNA polymerase III sliding clamp (beta) subunit (PCNA family)
MDTIEQTRAVEGERESGSLNYALEVEGESLIELLEGALTHTHKDKSLPALHAVMLEGEGGYLTARATDRYRLIVGKIEVESGELTSSLVSVTDIKRIVALLKESKISNKVYLNRVSDLLTVRVSVNGNSLTLTLIDANYPPSFDDLLNKPERLQLGEINFNPAFMADYARIAGKGNAVRVEFMGLGKPMLIHLPIGKVEWRALLMPMRIK